MPLQNMSQFTGCVVTDPSPDQKFLLEFAFPATLPDPRRLALAVVQQRRVHRIDGH